MNPKCPFDGGRTSRFSSTKILKCTVCMREYGLDEDLEKRRKWLNALDAVLVGAVDRGANPAQLIADLAAKHLASDETDPVHFDGKAFAQLFQKSMGGCGVKNSNSD